MKRMSGSRRDGDALVVMSVNRAGQVQDLRVEAVALRALFGEVERTSPRFPGLEVSPANLGIEHQHEESQEQHQVNRALQDIGAATREGERADREREQQQDRLDLVEPELDVAVDDQADREDCRDGEADRRQGGAEEDVDRALQPVGERRPERADAFGGEHQNGDDDAANCGRRARVSIP
jgi:hypothetical protein